MTTLYHGGKAGLLPGELLVPSPPHVFDGCPICVARAMGRTVTVGAYRRWLELHEERAAPVLKALEGAADDDPIDPPTERDRVYLTSDREYARWYAARSGGDLYEVAPVGACERSPTDLFPTWMARAARVVGICERGVRLRRRERRALLRRWKRAEKRRPTPRPPAGERNDP